MLFSISLFSGNQNLVMALVGNKSDLEAKREVETEVLIRSHPFFSFRIMMIEFLIFQSLKLICRSSNT